ncbi:MAG: ABC transporter permease subunit [Clostridium sp.]|nr:ABC transporter permease subunit [Clostridium sp.]
MTTIVFKSSNISQIYDATVGAGSLLLTVGKHLDSDAQKDIHYYGQEKDLPAPPISGNVILLSKFIVMVLWSLILSTYVLILGLILGEILNISGWSAEIVLHGIWIFIVCAVFTIFLSTPVAFFASVGRGYLSPFGFMIFILVFAQIIVVIGYGRFFPWSIPALIGGISGNDNGAINGINAIIIALTSTFGLISTTFWWKYAEQN